LLFVIFSAVCVSASAQSRTEPLPVDDALRAHPRDASPSAPTAPATPAVKLDETDASDSSSECAPQPAGTLRVVPQDSAPKAEVRIVPPEVGSGIIMSPLTPPVLAEAKPANEPFEPNERGGFNWDGAIKQSMLFLAVQQGYRLTEEKTRREFTGPFFRDYFDSVKSLGGWEDGGRFFTNYIGHPMQGAMEGYIQIHNDPKGIRQEFGFTGPYWKSRLKAMGWAAIWSTQFEIGPLSQASLGNVGAGKFEQRKMAYVDIVITPTMGTAWIVTEDVLDKYVVRWIERKTDIGFVRNASRVILNPIRSCTNLLRFKVLWHRDTRENQ
jgi:hypothetical protein